MAFEDSLKSISLNADSSIAGFTGVSGIAAGGGPSTFVKIASIAFSTPNVTVTTAAAHGYSVGDVVYIANATTAGNNGGFTVASIGSATTFTFANTSGAAQAGAAGTVNKTNFNQLYRFVKITGAKTAGLCTASDDLAIGVLQNKPQYTGQAAQVGFLGVSYVVTGSGVGTTNITAGDKISPDALGAAVKTAPTVLNADVSTSSGFAVSGGIVTLTLGTSTAFKVGDTINITGATSARNNGAFTVATVTSGTVLTYANAVGVAENGVASATTVGTRATAIRQSIIAGIALASSSTPGELIPVLLTDR